MIYFPVKNADGPADSVMNNAGKYHGSSKQHCVFTDRLMLAFSFCCFWQSELWNIQLHDIFSENVNTPHLKDGGSGMEMWKTVATQLY